MSKKKLAQIIAVCIIAIIVIVVITMLSPTPSEHTPAVLVTRNCTNIAMTSLEAQGEVTNGGGATITRRGFYYGAGLLYELEFDGINAQVVLPEGSQPTGPFTVAIRCKPTSWDHTAYPMLFGGYGLVGYADNLSGIAITRCYDTNTGLDELFFDVADGTNEARRTINPPISDIAPVGQWSFIVLTNSGVAEPGGLKLYRNSAVLIDSTTGAETVRWLSNYSALGYIGTARGCFKGIISEVLIYDRALSKAEIKALYDGQDVTGGLRGFWKLDEGSGDTVYDSSGNNNHGSLEGNIRWVLDDWDLTGGDSVYETGKFGTGTYSLNITGLEPDTWYRIMAFAENKLGISYGNVVSCKTLK